MVNHPNRHRSRLPIVLSIWAGNPSVPAMLVRVQGKAWRVIASFETVAEAEAAKAALEKGSLS